MSEYNCVTHHYACDCREAEFNRIAEENKILKNNNNIFNIFTEDSYIIRFGMILKKYEGEKFVHKKVIYVYKDKCILFENIEDGSFSIEEIILKEKDLKILKDFYFDVNNKKS